MVKQVILRAHLESIEPQTAFRVLFGDDKFMKRYHREINGDSHAEVSRWSADGQRHVKFVTPLNAPPVVRRLLGQFCLGPSCTLGHHIGHLYRPLMQDFVSIVGRGSSDSISLVLEHFLGQLYDTVRDTSVIVQELLRDCCLSSSYTLTGVSHNVLLNVAHGGAASLYEHVDLLPPLFRVDSDFFWLTTWHGVDILKVKDIQKHSRAGNCFRIKSDPVIDVPGGEKLCTSGEIVLEPGRGNRGTLLTITIVLEFKGGVWGMQGTVESFMEEQANKSFQGWIKMARAFWKEELEKSSKVVHSPSGSEESVYHDLERLDSGSPNSVPDTPLVVPVATTMGGEQQHLEIWFVNSVMRELHGIQVSTTVTKAHLELLLSKLQRLEDDMHVVKCLLQQNPSPSFHLSPRAWRLGGVCVATAVILGVRYAYVRRATP